jgi:hypothetical protein
MSSRFNKSEPGRCSNCGTTQGPFVPLIGFPGIRSCGLPRRAKATDADQAARTTACNSRRNALYAAKEKAA